MTDFVWMWLDLRSQRHFAVSTHFHTSFHGDLTLSVGFKCASTPRTPNCWLPTSASDARQPSAHSSLPSWCLTDISFTMCRAKTASESPPHSPGPDLPYGPCFSRWQSSVWGCSHQKLDGIPTHLSLHSKTRRWGNLFDSTTHYPQSLIPCHSPELLPLWDPGVGHDHRHLGVCSGSQVAFLLLCWTLSSQSSAFHSVDVEVLALVFWVPPKCPQCSLARRVLSYHFPSCSQCPHGPLTALTLPHTLLPHVFALVTFSWNSPPPLSAWLTFYLLEGFAPMSPSQISLRWPH